MSENPLLGESLKGRILIVEVYFKTKTDNRQNDARRWLKSTLPKNLSPYGKLEPIRYALLKYIQEFSSRKEAGKAVGGEYSYIIEEASPNFLAKLLAFLEDVEKRVKEGGEPKWFGDYHVYLANVITYDRVSQVERD